MLAGPTLAAMAGDVTHVDDGGYRLGIDFGTSHTVAVLRWPDGHARPLLFDGSPLLPSAVYAQPDGRLLVGRDAIHAARLDPARFEPTPKRLITLGTTHIGAAASTATPTDLVTAVLTRVRDEAVRVSGAPADTLDVTLTHPAGWDSGRIATLARSGTRAGFPAPRLLPEPVAAAGYFVAVLGRTIPPGSALVVYDFGGGTFDASAVAPDGSSADAGYRVLALGGLDDVGGADLDEALLRHITQTHRGADPEAWLRLEHPQTAADRRHRRLLVEDVRAAKEMLSRAPSASVPIPLLEIEVQVSRAELDALARPLVDRTVATTQRVIREATVAVAAVLLVGGSSRIPLVAELLRAGTGSVPSTIDQPETVVAEGSIRLASGGTGLTRAALALQPPALQPPAIQLPAIQPPAIHHLPAIQSSAALAPAAPVARAVRTWAPPADPWATQDALGSGEPTTRPVQPTSPAPPALPPLPALPPVQPVPVEAVLLPPGTHQATARVQPRVYRAVQPKRRRWLLAAAAAAVIVGSATGTVLALPYLGASATTDPPGRSSPVRSPYVRAATPGWLPAGWQHIVDDERQPSVVEGVATNGGSCRYQGAGVVHVTRTEYDVSGCVMTAEVRAQVTADVAVEAELGVASGCGGMWARTATTGYFLALCADGAVHLHRLAEAPPSDATRIGGPWRATTGTNRSGVVVLALLATGDRLTVWVDGVAQPTVVDDAVRTGRVGIGGFAPHPTDTLDATIGRFRAWAPTVGVA